MMRLGILSSHRGSTLFSMLDTIKEKKVAASIEVVISQNENAHVLEQAKAKGLNTRFVSAAGLSREIHESTISKVLQSHAVEWVILIGYDRILSRNFISTWRNKILNVHPSLLPAYSGMMDLAVHRAVLAAQEKLSGCTVHYVTEDVDSGPIITQKTCPVLSNDTPEILKKRVQSLEAEALVEAFRIL